MSKLNNGDGAGASGSSVAETMDRDVPTIAAALRVGELAERIAKHDPEVSHHQGLFIVSSEGKLQGVTTRGDVLQY